MLKIPNIAVLITCHNRKDKTLACLQNLFLQDGLDRLFKIQVFLVDDGSIDGTSMAIQSKFPDVNIIKGNGNLFWNRGMHLAWRTASKESFRYYLWLNDDTFLFKDSICNCLKMNSYDIIVGTTMSKTNIVTYGGYKDHKLLNPNGKYQECDYFNGNFVLVSKNTYELVGNLDPIFHHALGDIDYGLRALKKGLKIFIAPKCIGVCESNLNSKIWINPKINLVTRVKFFYSPLSGVNPVEYFPFLFRHFSILFSIKLIIKLHLSLLIPKLFLNEKI